MANEAYVATGTALNINGEAGADYAWSMEGVANAAGRVSAQVDLGASPRPGMYKWSCKLQFQATPTQFKGVELYIAKAPDGSNTDVDGAVGVADAALTDSDQRYNLQYIGYVTCESATSSVTLVASGVFACADRYLSLVGYNDSGASIHATDSAFKFVLQPYSWQGQ